MTETVPNNWLQYVTYIAQVWRPGEYDEGEMRWRVRSQTGEYYLGDTLQAALKDFWESEVRHRDMDGNPIEADPDAAPAPSPSPERVREIIGELRDRSYVEIGGYVEIEVPMKLITDTIAALEDYRRMREPWNRILGELNGNAATEVLVYSESNKVTAVETLMVLNSLIAAAADDNKPCYYSHWMPLPVKP